MNLTHPPILSFSHFWTDLPSSSAPSLFLSSTAKCLEEKRIFYLSSECQISFLHPLAHHPHQPDDNKPTPKYAWETQYKTPSCQF